MGYSLSRLMPPPIKGVDGSVVGLGFTVVIEDDYEYEIMRARVSALAGKRDSRCHSTRSFGGNVLVLRKQAIKPHQMLEVSSYFFNDNNSATFFGEKKNYSEAFRGVYFLGIRE